MVNRIRELEARVTALERLVRELRWEKGLDAAELDRFLFDEALEHMASTGDPSLLKKYLREKNAREGRGQGAEIVRV